MILAEVKRWYWNISNQKSGGGEKDLTRTETRERKESGTGVVVEILRPQKAQAQDDSCCFVSAQGRADLEIGVPVGLRAQSGVAVPRQLDS
jgi:hypothetical protein